MKSLNKQILRISLILSLIFIVNTSYSQVLMSLIFGDALNSDKVEFGLDGGLNFSNMSNSSGNMAFNWNLGFFFYISLNEKSWIHTGVLIKSRFGVNGLNPYPTGDPEVDSLMITDGKVNRVLSYFNVPITYTHYVYKDIFLEGGVMLGLRNKCYDDFVSTSSVGDDVTVKRNIKKKVTPLDAGALVGAGYKFQKGLGIAVGTRYYYGFVNAYSDYYGVKHKNSNWYLYVTIPIGKGKAERKRKEKEQELKEQPMNKS